MNIGDISKLNCTGCCACVNICPKNAIKIVTDDEGFYVPRVNEKLCVDCGKCYSACPSNENAYVDESLSGYLVRLKDKIKLKKSASGGAFFGIASFMIESYGALVAGAAITEDLSVKHIIVESRDDLAKLQNSKYVQSYVGNVYQQIRNALDRGRTVLFSGTPCQIAGLYAVIPLKKRERLYTVDLVCHGVPSPAILKRQIDFDSKSKQGRVVDFRFRYKNPKAEGNISFFMMVMIMARGFPLVRRVSQDVYLNLFMQGLDFRECCYNCKYANLKRIADFTIGDCDSRDFYPHFYPGESNSILLINSKRADSLWKDISKQFDFTALDVPREAEYNHQLKHPFKRPKQRDGIYEDLLNNEWLAVKNKYSIPQNRMDRYKLLILLNTPAWVKSIFAKIKRR
ncbi:Coenzyme F420 hydrogenase/dehydrogenase, beta subunit C-terminal domain [Fibrobacter succinogenes]|uniref:Coenzyme F420 hydrogenase/dehydrogenase, beta subunit N-term n=1 Tax=Fibrobacter succinogenes TaxID=833 RepID=A0A380RVC6_FIBSU|nr:Coenzyme F420 hydrogenase/dehydrogenase, beta subunit C-terminal domain [Fibrobacter succinogenes]PWJ37001.1 coenzyme F420 hydrogenase/dehydrogenase beta subunit [Fibrobacter succinogenes subsp. elongatus]SUQ19249.1 Coenzyme F420 hydrogenase/dehydrogenase, beta subunit N-term [Fibrobacter succinogenes]